jgi:autotransporter-associated beta strand protein
MSCYGRETLSVNGTRTARWLAIVAAVPVLAASSTFAGSAMWKTSPNSGNWNRAGNWIPQTIPNGPSDTATFAISTTSSVFLSANTAVDGIIFDTGGDSFTFTVAPSSNSGLLALEFDGFGITNNSGSPQNFVTAANGTIVFKGQATADNASFTNTNNGAVPGHGEDGATLFTEFSTAGNATFTNHGGVAYQSFQGLTEFSGSSTAGNATFINNGSEVSQAPAGFTAFFDTATADNARIVNHGGTFSGANGGFTFFDSSSSTFGPSAGNATLIALAGQNGGGPGAIQFYNNSEGGSARMELFGDGNLDIGEDSNRTVTVGSIEGDGNIFLGSRNLAVGRNNQSTEFSGVIQDGGIRRHAVGGSLTKIGIGKLVLSHRNTYTGGTTVKRGKLVVNNVGGSGTGSGPVQVERGILGGKGIIEGAVSMGTGFGAGAFLAPGYLHGAERPGALTIQGLLTFNGDGVFQMQVNSSSSVADEVAALGVAITLGAKFAFADIGNNTLSVGTVFTIINNTSATPIAGTFSNLHDGSTFSSNGNTYQVSYEGGDGNDLTLTVVP